eukprot:512740_1
MDFRKCKKIVVETKDTVFGFVRESEHILQQQHVPDRIRHICLLYYFENDDEWDPHKIGRAYGDPHKTLTHGTDRSGHHAFLRNIVNHGKHRWKFRINQLGLTGFNGIVGVFAVYPTEQQSSFGIIDHKASHAICAETGQYVTFFGNRPIDYAVACKSDAILEMICDISECTLRYKINGTDYGTMCALDPTKEYKAGVYMYLPNDSITLLK